MRRFKDRATRDLWEGIPSKAARRAVPLIHHARLVVRLDLVCQAGRLASFAALPPGAQFKELQGVLRGTYQLRIAGPYRIRFKWQDGRACDIQAGNFHDGD